MSSAEIKLELFRKIDSLTDLELNRVYEVVVSILASSEKYTLTNSEKKAIDESLEYSKAGETYSHESVLKEAQKTYPQLKFRCDK